MNYSQSCTLHLSPGSVKAHFSQLLGAVFDGSGTVSFHRAVAAPLILRNSWWPTQKKYRWLPGSKKICGWYTVVILH